MNLLPGHQAVPLSLLLIMTLVCGCGSSSDEGPRRAAVFGTVTLNGEPIQNGTLNLKPLSRGSSGPTGGPIRDGRYSIPSEVGPTFGKYRVEIYGFEKIASELKDIDSVDEADKTRQIVPAKYNTKSNVELEVKSESVQQDFSID